MLKNFRSVALLSFVTTFSFFGVFMTNASAQCGGFLPEFLERLICGPDPVQVLVNRIQVGFLLAFGAVILIAVGYVILTAIKYVRSKGDSGEMEESNKAMQSILYGVGALFVGVIGIAVVLIFFGGFNLFPQPICIQAPDSYGCYACADSSGDYRDICNVCNDDFDHTLGGSTTCDEEIDPDDSDEVVENFLNGVTL
ncbi:hypothetical protein KC717_05855 [Candidatus Dojkabacteria bacterium]|uniref:Uncharacterized protein n=1 Tax=Candidatus Dojkabacteria bacterium TaxID=2099670 RepID=A0A955L9P8_9BACT|nr:hypothetical protein [Candidatus Dojkabacteria bacterium]